ncbi:MAG: methyltransferase family protein [Candidatus Aminicenantales bacterium]
MNKGDMKSHLWFRSIVGVTVLVVLLFLSGGRLDYWQAWAYILLNIFFIGLTNWVLRDNPSLLRERIFPGRGVKPWDRVYSAVSTPLYFLSLVLAGLDAGRRHWTPRLPLLFYMGIIVLFCLGQSLMLWAKRANNFFSSVVRIQADRGQTVCWEGPYRYVRHPGYLGGLTFGLSAPLLLGSVVALIPSLLAALILVVRTGLEDNTLLGELEGYRQYANSVKFRLLPHIW